MSDPNTPPPPPQTPPPSQPQYQQPVYQQPQYVMAVGQPHVARPGGITLLVLIGVVQGLVGAGAGLFVLLERNSARLQDQADMSSEQLSASGISMIVVGLLFIVLASMLGGGSQFVRWLYGIVTMVNVSFALWGVIGLHGEQQMAAAFSLVFGVVILWILFGSERTDRFFAQG